MTTNPATCDIAPQVSGTQLLVRHRSALSPPPLSRGGGLDPESPYGSDYQLLAFLSLQ